MNKKSILYYGSRVTQRILLCMVVGATIVHWITVLIAAGTITLISNLENTQFKNSSLVSDDINKIIDIQHFIVLRWAAICILVTCLLLLIARFRKYEKPMIVDSITLTIFCLVSVAFSQTIIRAFISRLAL